jgi:lipopolysaccharide export system protein LptC
MIRQFLLGFGLLIMVGGFLLIWDSPPKSFMRQQQGQVEKVPRADSYMTAVTSRRFSKTGSEQLIISSPKIELYTGDSKVLMSQPSILSIDQQTGANAVTLNAQQGSLSNDGETLTLSGNVVAVIDGQQGSSQLSTDTLSYVPETNIATTDDRFKLVTPQVKISGKGLNANLASEVFTIKSKVQAVHDPI